MAAKKKRGRPKLPKGKERGVVLTLRLTAAERKALQRAAKAAKEPLSAWARSALLRAADELG